MNANAVMRKLFIHISYFEAFRIYFLKFLIEREHSRMKFYVIYLIFVHYKSQGYAKTNAFQMSCLQGLLHLEFF